MAHVFVLDLDNTIIGNIKPQVAQWEISKQCKSIKFDYKAFQTKLKQGIIRPGFLEFVKYAQSQGCTIYVYTASQNNWALFVISQIEKALGIKLARPIFTRKHCHYHNGSYKKNTRALKAIKADKVTIIDNLNTYHAADQADLVVCPAYNFLYPENIGANISYIQFKENAKVINEVMEKYIPNYHATNDYWTFQKRSSIAYLHAIGDMNQKKDSQDNFFTGLTLFMKSNPKHKYAKYINRYLRSIS